MLILYNILFSLILAGGLSASWDNYYENTLNSVAPQETLQLAHSYFDLEGKSVGSSIDLGTGTGRDALYLLEQGWKVLAVDAEPLALEILLSRVNPKQLDQLEVMVSSFEEMTLPGNIDLINASFSLAFCNPSAFPKCWQNIINHLSHGGRFAGQFFGENDAWATNQSMTFHSKEEVLNLFKDFTIEFLQEEEGLLPTASGEMKYWHVFHIVAKKMVISFTDYFPH